MAKEIVLTDDLHKSRGEYVPADETMVISVNGETVSIDLSQKHAAQVRDFFKPLREAGESVKSRGRKPSSSVANSAPSTVKKADGTKKKLAAKGSTEHIREWARTQGWEVGPRGRIPNEVMQAWEKSPEAERWQAAQTAQESAPASESSDVSGQETPAQASSVESEDEGYIEAGAEDADGYVSTTSPSVSYAG